MMLHHVVHESLCNLNYRKGMLQGHEMSDLCEPVNHKEDGRHGVRFGKATDEVY